MSDRGQAPPPPAGSGAPDANPLRPPSPSVFRAAALRPAPARALAASLVFAAALPAVPGGAAEPSGAPTAEALHHFSQPHMGTEFAIRAWAAPERAEALREAAAKAFARVGELNSILSDYHPESELNDLVRAPAGVAVPVGEDLFTVLSLARELSEATDGAFDATVGPLVRLWRRSRVDRTLPDPERISRALARTGYRHLELDPERRTVLKKIDGMLLDLGGIGKGYAADAALAVLREEGFPRSLVAAAGDIAAGDPPPGEDGWSVGLDTLEGGGAPAGLARVRLANRAVSTSGDAWQYIEIDGVRYSHIVSTRTGLGLTERIAASVLAPDATTSDSHATAVVLLGAKEGLKFIENQRGVECRITVLGDDGRETFVFSDGFPRDQIPQGPQEGPLPAP